MPKRSPSPGRPAVAAVVPSAEGSASTLPSFPFVTWSSGTGSGLPRWPGPWSIWPGPARSATAWSSQTRRCGPARQRCRRSPRSSPTAPAGLACGGRGPRPRSAITEPNRHSSRSGGLSFASTGCPLPSCRSGWAVTSGLWGGRTISGRDTGRSPKLTVPSSTRIRGRQCASWTAMRGCATRASSGPFHLTGDHTDSVASDGADQGRLRPRRRPGAERAPAPSPVARPLERAGGALERARGRAAGTRRATQEERAGPGRRNGPQERARDGTTGRRNAPGPGPAGPAGPGGEDQLSCLPADIKSSQASLTRSVIDASAALPQVRGS